MFLQSFMIFKKFFCFWIKYVLQHSKNNCWPTENNYQKISYHYYVSYWCISLLFAFAFAFAVVVSPTTFRTAEKKT